MGNTFENTTHTNHQTQTQQLPKRKPHNINSYLNQRDGIQMYELHNSLIPKSQEEYIYQHERSGCLCCLSNRQDNFLEQKLQGGQDNLLEQKIEEVNSQTQRYQQLLQQHYSWQTGKYQNNNLSKNKVPKINKRQKCNNYTNIHQSHQSTQNILPNNNSLPHNQQHDDNDSDLSRLSQSLSQFRQSFRTDNSQTTIYLEPPQFILSSPLLMRLLNKTILEFFQFTEFLGWLTFKLFRLTIYSLLFFLIINLILIIHTDNIDCLTTRNNGIIELGRWLVLDFVVSVLIILFLWIHKDLLKNYKTKRRNKYLNGVVHIVQCSWIGLYFIKFFILNSLGSCQFFTYTYKHRLDQSVPVGVRVDEGSSSIPSSMSVIQCPNSLSFYLIGFMVYNYISVLFLCLFVVDFLV